MKKFLHLMCLALVCISCLVFTSACNNTASGVKKQDTPASPNAPAAYAYPFKSEWNAVGKGPSTYDHEPTAPTWFDDSEEDIQDTGALNDFFECEPDLPNNYKAPKPDKKGLYQLSSYGTGSFFSELEPDA
jgi:hypothetical protein